MKTKEEILQSLSEAPLNNDTTFDVGLAMAAMNIYARQEAEKAFTAGEDYEYGKAAYQNNSYPDKATYLKERFGNSQ